MKRIFLIATMTFLGLSAMAQEDEPQKIDSNFIFLKAHVDPKFPGDANAWQTFIDKNLDLNVPLSKGAKDGRYNVVIEFIVERDGSLSGFRPFSNYGFGMEEEAIRVMKLSPKWEPAILDKRTVRVVKTQPITFILKKKK